MKNTEKKNTRFEDTVVMPFSVQTIPHTSVEYKIHINGELIDHAQIEDVITGKIKKVSLDVDSPARSWLAEHGYDRNMGARPMDRLVKDLLKKPLANEMLFGNLAQCGGSVKVTVNENVLKLDIISNENEAV